METFQFKLEGPIFQKGVPLHLAINALDDFQAIIDKTYMTAMGLQRITTRARDSFQLRATNFTIGSFVTDFDIYTGSQLILPIIGTLGPYNIWEYTKETFKFLKMICTSIKHGSKPSYEFDKNKNMNVHIGDVHQTFNGCVFNIGEKTISKYQDLSHLLEPGKLETISAGSEVDPEIVLTTKDKNLFDIPTQLEKKPIEIDCEIFDFNKFLNEGRLRVGDEQTVPPGDYKFTIVGSQDNVNYIYSMLKSIVTIRCLIEKGLSPFGGEKIARLHVTGVNS